ncbi:hypothetical protein M1O24_00160 [Dehalococcoidia bacterium]|nr:hypothetical protein [Dehalococcoidia bacterium]
MGERNLSNIFLIGFSYSGKSQAGRKVAERLGWDFTDTDDEIVAQAKNQSRRYSLRMVRSTSENWRARY